MEEGRPLEKIKEILYIDAGHAELENNTILYIYGNAYEVVLEDENL